MAARGESHIDFLMEVAHDDVVDIGVLGRELFCPFDLKGIGVGGVRLVVVVVAVGISDGIVFFAIVCTPAITKGIAKAGYHQMAKEPLCDATFEYAIKNEVSAAFFAKSVPMGEIESFAFDVDEIAFLVYY